MTHCDLYKTMSGWVQGGVMVTRRLNLNVCLFVISEFLNLASTVSTAPIIAKRSSVRSERRQSMRAELPENGKRVKKHNAPLMSISIWKDLRFAVDYLFCVAWASRSSIYLLGTMKNRFVFGGSPSSTWGRSCRLINGCDDIEELRPSCWNPPSILKDPGGCY